MTRTIFAMMRACYWIMFLIFSMMRDIFLVPFESNLRLHGFQGAEVLWYKSSTLNQQLCLCIEVK